MSAPRFLCEEKILRGKSLFVNPGAFFACFVVGKALPTPSRIRRRAAGSGGRAGLRAPRPGTQGALRMALTAACRPREPSCGGWGLRSVHLSRGRSRPLSGKTCCALPGSARGTCVACCETICNDIARTSYEVNHGHTRPLYDASSP